MTRWCSEECYWLKAKRTKKQTKQEGSEAKRENDKSREGSGGRSVIGEGQCGKHVAQVNFSQLLLHCGPLGWLLALQKYNGFCPFLMLI